MKYDIKKYLDQYYSTYNTFKTSKYPSDNVIFFYIDLSLMDQYIRRHPEKMAEKSEEYFLDSNTFFIFNSPAGEIYLSLVPSNDGGMDASCNKLGESFSKEEVVAIIQIIGIMVHDKRTRIAQEQATVSRKHSGKSKVVPVTYIRIDGYENQRRANGIPGLVWTHSWECMGHWRKIDEEAVGKDRDGVYQIKGKTWVNPCTKGSGELIKKIRVIRN